MKTFTSAIIFVCLSLSLYGQDKGLEDAAKKALGDLQALAAMRDIKMPDMPSPEMLTNARFGEMIPQHIIKLDRLKEYGSGSDPKSLVEKIDRYTIPILSSTNALVSSVEVERTAAGEWRTADLNNFAYVKAGEMVLRENDLLPNEIKLIRVPAFNLHFLARETARGTELALLSDKPFNNIPAKRFTPAADVMTQLSTVAKSYNGLPW